MKASDAAHAAAVILAKTKNVRLRKIAVRLIKIEAQLIWKNKTGRILHDITTPLTY